MPENLGSMVTGR